MKADYTVVITRPDGESFAELVRAAGFTVLQLPLFSVVACEQTCSAEELRGKLINADWLLFTSRNGVRFFTALAGRDLPPGIKVAAIGERTAHFVANYLGRSVDYQGEGHSSERFASALFAHIGRGQRLLLVTAKEHRGVIAGEALLHGIAIDTVTVYQRHPLEIDSGIVEFLLSKPSQQLLWPFFSPSAFHECLGKRAEFPNLLKNGRVFAIGQTTSDSIREKGFEVFDQALNSTERGMLEALLRAVA